MTGIFSRRAAPIRGRWNEERRHSLAAQYDEESMGSSPLLMASRDRRFQGKVFYTAGGERRHVLHAEWIEANGFSWPDLRWVEGEVLQALSLGPPVPNRWTLDDWNHPPRTDPQALREILTSRLAGSGIEVGAGCHPFPVPLHCSVRYIDRLPDEEFEAHFYGYKQSEDDVLDKVPLAAVADMENLAPLDDQSLDFVIASHVLEHTRNPLRALEQSYAKLRPGGSLLLVVPDKRRMFDKDRELTPLEHIILDYEQPCRDRDLIHYLEFYTKSFPIPRRLVFDVVKRAFDTFKDIHCHVWTHDTFAELVAYSRRTITPWSEVWSQPCLEDHPQGVEFYFALTR